MKVDFEGNLTYSDIVLRDIIATEQPGFFQRLRMKSKQRWFLDMDELQRDAIRIERFYRRRGFTNPQITFRVDRGRNSWQRRVVFNISEGPSITTERVSIVWDTDSTTADRLHKSPDLLRAIRRQPLREGEGLNLYWRPTP